MLARARKRPDPTVVLQVYRRAQRSFRRVIATDGDRVRSRVLGCAIRVVGAGAGARLRLATGDTGDSIYPTGEEAERATAEAERSAKEAERSAKYAALVRVAELEAELARRRR